MLKSEHPPRLWSGARPKKRLCFLTWREGKRSRVKGKWCRLSVIWVLVFLSAAWMIDANRALCLTVRSPHSVSAHVLYHDTNWSSTSLIQLVYFLDLAYTLLPWKLPSFKVSSTTSMGILSLPCVFCTITSCELSCSPSPTDSWLFIYIVASILVCVHVWWDDFVWQHLNSSSHCFGHCTLTYGTDVGRHGTVLALYERVSWGTYFTKKKISILHKKWSLFYSVFLLFSLKIRILITIMTKINFHYLNDDDDDKCHSHYHNDNDITFWLPW